MRLAEDEATGPAAAHDHGVRARCTPSGASTPCRSPTWWTTSYVGVPIDRVKPKASSRLQRERNLEADPRGTLLVDHWDRDDWSQLWWVRAELRWQGDETDRAAALAARLAERFTQYRDQPFDRVLVLRIVGLTGWAATGTVSWPSRKRRNAWLKTRLRDDTRS